MQLGIHLPQFGRASGPDSIQQAARLAEQLGYEGVWVSDHVIQPVGQDYPSPYLYDALLTLTYAAATTEKVSLGTSVLVAAQYEPLWLANALASLDALSKGRLIVGMGVGWSEAEYNALGRSFHDRGKRTDELIDMLRVAWENDPVSFDGEFIHVPPVKLLPKPARRIPLWIGGSGEPAYRRAASRGDGFHAIGLKPEQAKAVVERIRRDRPAPEFPISLRTGWDPQGMDPDLIRRERDEFEEAGITYVVAAPWRSDVTSWLKSMELLAAIVGLTPR
jgi:probable F420-dependent oxidoreductase